MLPLIRPKTRLLLLDDDPSMQRLMAGILKRQGYRVDIVSTGRQAIERIGRISYAALLLDVMTPTEGGMTVIEHLRAARPELLGRVLVVSAAPPSALKTIPPRIGVLRKPFAPAALVDAVARTVVA
jgi:DNA-binding response OmpR family regulator